MRVAYADPPYPGCAHLYRDHPDFAGEVDHAALARDLCIVRATRKPTVSGRVVMRDWISEPITMKRGLTGAKPERVCRWLFEVLGLEPDDELVDLFPGTGAVTRAWDGWRSQMVLPV